MATNKPRFSITIDNETAEALDDYRFGNRINSKSEAVAELIRLGLEAAKEREAAKGGDRQ